VRIRPKYSATVAFS